MILDVTLPFASTLFVASAHIIDTSWHRTGSANWLTNRTVKVFISVTALPADLLIADLLFTHVVVWNLDKLDKNNHLEVYLVASQRIVRIRRGSRYPFHCFRV